MAGKIGIRIPSHNSLTPSLFDELLKIVATSRKMADTKRVRRRLTEKYHKAIVSTGLSYLAYLGAVKKAKRGYKPSRSGKKIGWLLAKDHMEEATVEWGKLLKRHKLFSVFQKFFSNYEQGTLEDFGLYLTERTHAKWNVSAIRSRVSRLCELFAEKGLVEYQNSVLSPIGFEQKELEASRQLSTMNKPRVILSTTAPEISSLEDVRTKPSSVAKLPSISMATNSWPVRIEMKIEVSDEANPEVIGMILSFLKDLQETCTRADNSGD